MKKNHRRAKDEMKHEAILKAATRLFLKKGYTNTSMDAVAHAARVTKQTVYAHYTNKDALFKQMVVTLCEKHRPPYELMEREDKPIEEMLYEIGLSFLNMITSHEGLATTRLVIAEVNQHPKLAQRFYEGGIQTMIGMLSQFLSTQSKRGTLAIQDPGTAALYFFAMLKGRYHLRMILGIKPVPSGKEKAMHARETVRLFMKAYGRPKS